MSRAMNPDAPPRRRVRRWVKFVIAGVVLLAVLGGLDVLAGAIAARRLAGSIQSAQHLAARPDVTIAGFPFLTQVLRGSYGNVTIRANSPVGTGGVQVSNAVVHLHGVRVHLSDVLHGTVQNVPVRSGDGTAVLGYPQVDALLRRYGGSLGSALTVVGATGGRARIQGPLGLSLTVTAKVTNGDLTIAPDASALSALPSLVRAPIKDALARPIPLPPFPFGVTLRSAVPAPDGIRLVATAHDSVFPIR